MMSDVMLFFDCFRLCDGVISTAKRDALSENVSFQAASTNKGEQPVKVIKFRPPTDSTRATHRVSLSVGSQVAANTPWFLLSPPPAQSIAVAAERVQKRGAGNNK